MMARIRGKLKQTAAVFFALCCALIIGAIIMLAIGANPLTGYAQLFKGAFGSAFTFGGTLEKFVPLLLTGLAFMIGTRAGMFNMGVEGSLYLGALASAAVAIYLPSNLPGIVVIILSMLGGSLIGALWALIPALLKVYLRVNEVCSTILLNYVAIYFTTFMVLEPMHGGASSPQTLPILPQAVLKRILPPSRANIGVFIALLILVAMWFIFNRTTLGYRINSTGENPRFAETMGINPKKYMIIGMLLSGAVGGLAGTMEVLGIHGVFLSNFSVNTAFDGMLAALIANGSFVALPILSIFIAALKVGALGMERFTSIPKSLIDMIIALFILFATMRRLFDFLSARKAKNLKKNEVAVKEGHNG